MRDAEEIIVMLLLILFAICATGIGMEFYLRRIIAAIKEKEGK